MNLLEHVVLELALACHHVVVFVAQHFPHYRLAPAGCVELVHDAAGAGDLHQVAILQIDETIGHREQRQGVGAQVAALLGDADHQGAAMPRADDAVGPVGIDHAQCVGTFEAGDHRIDRGQQLTPDLQLALDQVRHHLGIGGGSEDVAVGHQLGLERLMILDDAVVHHGDTPRDMRVCVVLTRLAMGRPAGVGHAGHAGQRRGREQPLQGRYLAHLTGSAQLSGRFHQGHAGRIVTSIFEALESFHQYGQDVVRTHGSYDATHVLFSMKAPRPAIAGTDQG